jgi:hypothetical protein
MLQFYSYWDWGRLWGKPKDVLSAVTEANKNAPPKSNGRPLCDMLATPQRETIRRRP